MYRTPSKRQQIITRAIIYGIMTMGVIILVTVLVFLMLGYRFNKATSSIQQGGLVQFASRPIDANVTIGAAKLTDATPSKITINPGSYEVAMNRPEYLPWNKRVSVNSGEVLWLNYAQLVPNKVETKQLTQFERVSAVKSSPNGDRFALLQDPAKPSLTFSDVTGEAPKQTEITLPSAVIPEGKAITYGLSDWANDSNHIVVTMTYDNAVEYLVVDRRDTAKTINVSKSYTADIAELKFDPRSSDRMYIRSSSGDVRLVDTSSDTLSKVVASGVTYMSLYNSDALLLVQSTSPGVQTVGYLSLGKDEVRVLKKYTSSEKILVDAGTYYSEPYIAVSDGTQLEVFKSRSLPSSTSSDSVALSDVHESTLPAVPQYLSVRSSGRFVVAQYDAGVQTFDIELMKQTETSFKQPTTQEIRWLDRYHYYIANAGQLEVMEFDGANAHQIAPLSTGFDAVQSDDGKFIYTINASAKGFAIQQSRMILE